MTNELIEQIKEENEALKEAVCNAYLRGLFEDRRKRIPDMEARILADAEVIKAAEELAEAVTHEREIVCQDMGKQSEAIQAVEVALNDFHQAQARAALTKEKNGGCDA